MYTYTRSIDIFTRVNADVSKVEGSEKFALSIFKSAQEIEFRWMRWHFSWQICWVSSEVQPPCTVGFFKYWDTLVAHNWVDKSFCLRFIVRSIFLPKGEYICGGGNYQYIHCGFWLIKFKCVFKTGNAETARTPACVSRPRPGLGLDACIRYKNFTNNSRSSPCMWYPMILGKKDWLLINMLGKVSEANKQKKTSSSQMIVKA